METGLKAPLIQDIIDCAKMHDVDRLYLFGSRARGDYKERSDIDLAFYGGDSRVDLYYLYMKIQKLCCGLMSWICLHRCKKN